MRQTSDEATGQRIGYQREHDGGGVDHLHDSLGYRGGDRHDHVKLETRQFSHEDREPVGLRICEAGLHDKVLSFDPATLA